jgi:hypothetical protein
VGTDFRLEAPVPLAGTGFMGIHPVRRAPIFPWRHRFLLRASNL